MKLGWSLISNSSSNVELQSIKSDLSDVLEDFAVEYQVDILPMINKSLVIIKNMREFLLLIRSNIDNRDFEENDLARIVEAATRLHKCLNEYIVSISPPTSVDLCDARLSALSLCLTNLTLVTANIFTGSQYQWLSDSHTDIDIKIRELRDDFNYVEDNTSTV